MNSLKNLFAPESIAVIGASRREGTLGRMFLDAIVQMNYKGITYPVNPKADKINNNSRGEIRLHSNQIADTAKPQQQWNKPLLKIFYLILLLVNQMCKMKNNCKLGKFRRLKAHRQRAAAI